MTVEIKMAYREAAHLFTFSKKLGYLVPTDDVRNQMKAQGYVFEKHWDVGFRDGTRDDVVFVFANNQAAITFTMYFQ